MKRNRFPQDDVANQEPPLDENLVWTEKTLEVRETTTFPEKLGEGKSSFSTRLLLEEPLQSSSNTRKRLVVQLAFGLEEKDILTFARMLGRKVFISQLLPESSLEREDLEIQLKEARDDIVLLEKKVRYLNDSLHHYVQESR